MPTLDEPCRHAIERAVEVIAKAASGAKIRAIDIFFSHKYPNPITAGEIQATSISYGDEEYLSEKACLPTFSRGLEHSHCPRSPLGNSEKSRVTTMKAQAAKPTKHWTFPDRHSSARLQTSSNPMKSPQRALNTYSKRTGPVYAHTESCPKNSSPEVKDPLPAFSGKNLPARREWFLRYGFDRQFDGRCG